MRTQLGSAEHPIDYNLQAVLPGVHARMTSQEEAIRQVVQRVSVLPELVQQISALPSLQSTEGLLRQVLTGALSSLGNPLPPGNPWLLGNSQPSFLPTTTNNNQDESQIDHRLRSTHDNIRSIYNEWFGLGDFEGVPISGGIAECEKKFGRKWRNKNSANRISRQSRVCSALQKEVDGGKSLDDVCREWDKVYINDCRKNLLKFVSWLQVNNFLSKSANRGRRSN